MDTILPTKKSSGNSLHIDSSDRSSGQPTPSTPGVTDGTAGLSLVNQRQVRVFTLFKHLPAELRVLIWQFACAPPGPRIYFLEPTAYTDEGRFLYPIVSLSSFQVSFNKWIPRIHWDISERTNDPSFRWSGKELLSVSVEARRVFLDRKTTIITAPKEQTRVESSGMVQTTDVFCVRVGLGLNGFVKTPLDPSPGEAETGFCHPDERPSPRRLALEIPKSAELIFHHYGISHFVPHWLKCNRHRDEFMHLDQLEVVYILDQHIKPRAQFDRQEDMPPEMYTKSFDGHHGSKFVAIDPEDKEAIRLWTIPSYCRGIMESVRYFNDFDIFLRNPTFHYETALPLPKLQFLACVTKSLQTQQLDDGYPRSAFAFT